MDRVLELVVSVVFSAGVGWGAAHVRIGAIERGLRDVRDDLGRLGTEMRNASTSVREEFNESVRHAHERIDKIFEQTQRILKIKAVE